MKLKREIENKRKKPIHELNCGETFIYEGMLHLMVSVPGSNNTLMELLDRNYCLAVNLQDAILRQIRIDIVVAPVRAEIVTE